MKRLITLMAVAAAALSLTACSGGGDDTVVVVDPLDAVPDTATQSVAGTVDYLVVLNKNPSDTREPIDITALLLPISDTTEPSAVE